MRVRDVDEVVDATRVMPTVNDVYEQYRGEEGRRSKPSSLKWMLYERSTVVAAFLCAPESRAATKSVQPEKITIALESLNKQPQDVVAADGDLLLLGIISSLWEFDKQTLLVISLAPMSGWTTPAVPTSAVEGW